MTVPTALVIAGLIALFVGIVGGGIKAKGVEVPQVAAIPRAVAVAAGLVFLSLGLWLYFQSGTIIKPVAIPAIPMSTATAAPSSPTSTNPPNPTDTPLHQPLVEIFPQIDGGEVFTFTNNGGVLSSKYLTTPGCVHSGVYGLQLAYTMKASAKGGWAVQWANTPGRHFDASRFSALTFWVRGASGKETFQIGLKDTGGNEITLGSDQLLKVSSSWVPATIPLSAFTGVDPALIENLSFDFNKNNGTGSLCIDDISFTP